MKNCIKTFSPLLLVAAFSLPLNAHAAGGDDPLLIKFQVDRLERRDSSDQTLTAWEIDAWVGKDLNKLWIKSRGERASGETTDNEIDLLYSRAVSPFWDLQLGLRHQFDPNPSQDWVGLGFKGEAPYLIESDISLFVNEDNLAELRMEFEYEYMLSRKWVLLPTLDASFFSDDDATRGIGSGLSTMELGLRLAWEMRRDFSIYAGVNLEKAFGNTADLLEAAGEDDSETQWVAGVGFWF